MPPARESSTEALLVSGHPDDGEAVPALSRKREPRDLPLLLLLHEGGSGERMCEPDVPSLSAYRTLAAG